MQEKALYTAGARDLQRALTLSNAPSSLSSPRDPPIEHVSLVPSVDFLPGPVSRQSPPPPPPPPFGIAAGHPYELNSAPLPPPPLPPPPPPRYGQPELNRRTPGIIACGSDCPCSLDCALESCDCSVHLHRLHRRQNHHHHHPHLAPATTPSFHALRPSLRSAVEITIQTSASIKMHPRGVWPAHPRPQRRSCSLGWTLGPRVAGYTMCASYRLPLQQQRCPRAMSRSRTSAPASTGGRGKAAHLTRQATRRSFRYLQGRPQSRCLKASQMETPRTAIMWWGTSDG